MKRGYQVKEYVRYIMLLALLLVGLLSGCAAPLPPAGQTAIKNAATIDFDIPDGLSADNVCFVGTKSGNVHILNINGSPTGAFGGSAFPRSGVNTLTVSYSSQPPPPSMHGATYTSVSSSRGGAIVTRATATPIQATIDLTATGPREITFNFEAGKLYFVDWNNISGNKIFFTGKDITFDIKEMTDPDQRKEAEQKLAAYKQFLAENPAKKAAYLTFSKEHPAYFEGTWQSQNWVAKASLHGGITFSGNIWHDQFGNTGTFMFNENTLILNGNQKTNDIYYYERKGDNLSIYGASPHYLINGEYHVNPVDPCVPRGYVDPQYRKATYSQIQQVVPPLPVRVDVQFQRNGQPMPAIDAQLRGDVERTLATTKAFTLSTDPATPAVISVLANNITEDLDAAAKKGADARRTACATGFIVADSYRFTFTYRSVTYRDAKGKGQQKSYSHALYTVIGHVPSPPVNNVEPTTLGLAFDKVVEDVTLNFIKDFQKEGGISKP